MNVTGVVKNNHIIISEPLNIPDGTEVYIELSVGHPVLNAFGICKQDAEWDRIAETIRRDRDNNVSREASV